MLFLNNFDNKLTTAIRDLPEVYRPLMSSLSWVGQPLVVITLGVIGYIVAWHRQQSAIEYAFIYAVVAFGLNIILKLLLHRGRPHGLTIKTLGLESYAFPSGHAFGTVIFYGLFAYLDIKYLVYPVNILVAVMLGIIIFLIGISRVYLGDHYPSDVVGGWALGLVSLVILTALAF